MEKETANSDNNHNSPKKISTRRNVSLLTPTPTLPIPYRTYCFNNNVKKIRREIMHLNKQDYVNGQKYSIIIKI